MPCQTLPLSIKFTACLSVGWKLKYSLGFTTELYFLLLISEETVHKVHLDLSQSVSVSRFLMLVPSVCAPQSNIPMFVCFSASRKRRKNAILFSEFSGFGFAYFWKISGCQQWFGSGMIFFSGPDPTFQFVSDPDPFTNPTGIFFLIFLV